MVLLIFNVYIKKEGKLTISRRYNQIPLLRSRPGEMCIRDSDGTVRNAAGNQLGKAKGNNRQIIAASYFFFFFNK